MNSREEEFTQQEELISADTYEVIKRILIMDDNPDITLTFMKVLQGPQIDDLTGERRLEANITKGKKKYLLKRLRIMILSWHCLSSNQIFII
jgi:hypothetical protein